MEIINNLKSNHIIEFKKLVGGSNELILASPFLFTDFGDFFELLDLKNLLAITLITTLHSEISELSKKTNSLISFIDYLDKIKIRWNIHIDNKLHGKIYLFKVNGSSMAGIISSANLTDNGMVNNHEWGVLIKDETILENIETELFSCIQKKNITQENLIELMLKTDEYSNSLSKKNKENIIVDIKSILLNQINISFTEETKFFIKPIGVQDAPVEIGRDFSNLIQQIYFAKRPVAVCSGDILICYGVGTTKLLSYFKVLSEPNHRDDGQDIRWPWFVEGENLSTNFGARWWFFDYTLASLQNEFRINYPDRRITYIGGDTLGALNFGADKIRLTKEFANFLIRKIEEGQNP